MNWIHFCARKKLTNTFTSKTRLKHQELVNPSESCIVLHIMCHVEDNDTNMKWIFFHITLNTPEEDG